MKCTFSCTYYYLLTFYSICVADNANNEIGAANECATEDLAKEMKNKKVLTILNGYLTEHI